MRHSYSMDYILISHCTLTSIVTVCTCTQGILTGMSTAGFSVSINERALGGEIVADALEAVLLHSWCPTHLARQV